MNSVTLIGKVYQALRSMMLRDSKGVEIRDTSAEATRPSLPIQQCFKRPNDFRVDIQTGVHARACTGGSIALAQSDRHAITGNLPNGTPFTAQIRVTRPHALVMLKLLALTARGSGFTTCGTA
jgi:hypothetical protein